MGFLDSLRKLVGGSGASRGGGGGRSTFGGDEHSYWIYAKCRRCGEPLRARVNTMNDPSQEDDDTWVVRKQLSGSGKNYCFQTVEVTLHFDAQKKNLLNAEATGGTLISAEEYEALAEAQAQQANAVEDEEEKHA
jgi:hypothetical protein